MTQFLFGASAVLLAIGLMAVGIQMGRKYQKESCGCHIDPFGPEETTGCACGGSCGCN